MSIEDKFFSKKIFAAPFGRYQARGDVPAPADEVLVGREGERAYFIDQLLRTGGRGAYLVTGHRGVGKTNFVRYCLSEYKSEVFERFLRSNVGRATFWDRVAVLALIVVFLLLALFVSEFAEFVGLGLGSGGSQDNPLRWLLLTPLFFLCLYPALFAREVLEIIFRARFGHRPGSIMSLVGLFVLAIAVWFLGPFGAPAVGMSRFLCAICAMHLWVQSTSFRPRTTKERWQFGRLNRYDIAFMVVLFLYVVFMPDELGKSKITPLKETFGNIGLACILLGIGCILRGLYIYRLKANAVSGKVHGSVAYYYVVPGTILLVIGWIAVLYMGIVWAIAVGAIATIGPLVFFGKISNRSEGDSQYRFSPQPLLVLFFKALLALTVSLQLAHPIIMKVRDLNLGVIFEQIDDGPSGEPHGMGEAEYNWVQNKLRKIREPVDEFWPDPEAPHPTQLLRSSVNLNRMTGLKLNQDGAQDKTYSVFHGLREEVLWLLCVFLAILSLFYIEYEWVVRSFLRPRADGAIDLEKFNSDLGLAEHRLAFRELAEVTFPWILYRVWLPVIVASVNLGFERLDHRRVIQAMLVSLKARYQQLFLAWNSTVANLGRILILVVALFLVNVVGDRWFAMPPWKDLVNTPAKSYAGNYGEICSFFEGRQVGKSAVNLICKLRWGNEIFHFLYYNIATSDISKSYEGKKSHLLFYLLPFQEHSWPSSQDSANNLSPKGVHVRVYHILLLFFFLLVGRIVLRRLPIFPYREHLKKIDEVIDQLSATTTLTSTTGLPQASNWLSGILRSERVRNVQQEPVDPRTVEFFFLHILEEIRGTVVSLPAGRTQLISLPTPEITFVFDELDKLGSRVEPGPEVASSGGAQQREILNAERRRSAELHRLLADMKNLLSSAPARFIFVGGRNLHDEWLADQTARQPLLTNIFNAEVYLPSLLTDDSRQEESANMSKEVQNYIKVQALRAQKLYEESLEKRRRASFSLSVEAYGEESFVPPNPRSRDRVRKPQWIGIGILKVLRHWRRWVRKNRVLKAGRRLRRDLRALPAEAAVETYWNAKRIEMLLTRLGRPYLKVLHHWRRWVRKSQLLKARRRLKRERRELSAAAATGKNWNAKRVEMFRTKLGRPYRTPCETNFGIRVLDVNQGVPAGFEEQLCLDFIHFLSYRSKGNPKRLKELLASFVRPVGRVILMREVREEKFPCEHVLMFDDVGRFRIQFLASVYRYLESGFGSRVLRHDDKLAMSVLFLADFLFKFHRRAFSWSNLERVDELVHIHRAPDMREILEKLVMDATSTVLHPIRNGMYDFRFHSEAAREIEFISRESQEEMAAFNFTLDESLALKSAYESAIQRLAGGAGRELQDLMAGLGELYEFDQEYETARLYYRKAISLLDAELREVIGGGEIIEEQSPALEIIGAFPEGQRYARLYITWGIARLRLMLQVGMTFELSRNYERGEVEYRNAYTLARSLLLAMLDNDGKERAMEQKIAENAVPSMDDRLQELKHLTILFQPAFAEAWIAEKLSGGVDTSVAHIEKNLWELREILPFVREGQLVPAEGPTDIKHSNFALIISELHNKAGDLYFMKGRQLMRLEDIIRSVEEEERQREALARREADRGLRGLSRWLKAHWASKKVQEDKGVDWRPPWKGQEGYLLQAHYHYCMALHELRRYVALRRENSRNQLNVWTAKEFGKRWPTLSRGSWPAFVFSAAGEAFNDLAESMLARVSFFGLFYRVSHLPKDLRPRKNDPIEFMRSLVERCTSWIETFKTPFREEEANKEAVFPIEGYSLSAGSLDGWLGVWRKDRTKPSSLEDRRLLDYDQSAEHNDETRLAMALNFIMVGGRYLERGGHLENAARELLKVCEITAFYLWWELATQQLQKWNCPEWLEADDKGRIGKIIGIIEECPWGDPAKTARRAYWRYLGDLSVYCLRKAEQLYRRSRGNGDLSDDRVLLGHVIPVFAFKLLCSLGLASSHLQLHTPGPDSDGLREIFERWIGPMKPGADFAAALRVELAKTMTRYSYPLINRMVGLSVLIQDGVMGDDSEASRLTVLGWAVELMELQSRMDAPMYFTPFSAGMAYGLSYWYCSQGGGFSDPEDRNHLGRVRHAAQRELNASEEMFTLRPTYYANISKLYYLYDDFNDRQTHFNHAIQMAGSELSSLLKYTLILNERSRAARGAAPATAPAPQPSAASPG